MGATRLIFPKGGLRLRAISLQRFLCIELCFCYCTQYSLRRNSVGKKKGGRTFVSTLMLESFEALSLLFLRLRWGQPLVFACDGIYKEKMIAPLGHLRERWRKHALQGDEEIAPNYYEAAAFEALKGRV